MSAVIYALNMLSSVIGYTLKAGATPDGMSVAWNEASGSHKVAFVAAFRAMKDYLTKIRAELDLLFLPGENSTTLLNNIGHVFERLSSLTNHLALKPQANAAQVVSSQEADVQQEDTGDVAVVHETQANPRGDTLPPQPQQSPPVQVVNQASAPKEPTMTDVFALIMSSNKSMETMVATTKETNANSTDDQRTDRRTHKPTKI